MHGVKVDDSLHKIHSHQTFQQIKQTINSSRIFTFFSQRRFKEYAVLSVAVVFCLRFAVAVLKCLTSLCKLILATILALV